MTRKPWQIHRREMLRGCGVALALPFLNGMNWADEATGSSTAKPELPKRLMVGYFAYGSYMPDAENGLPNAKLNGAHHDWSWWPCGAPGPLTFNQSAKPFEPLKEYVSYFQGLDHKGGWKLGGHSSGDVFATGADMVEKEKTNNISIDQVAANVHGHKTRFGSLVLGTEGGTGSYGMSKTLSHRGPGQPIPSLHRPREIFSRMFLPYAGEGVDKVRARLKREASVIDLLLDNSKSFHQRLGREDQHKMDEYLESVRAIEQRVERADKWTSRPLPEADSTGVNLDAAANDPNEFIRCMYDLIYLAFVTDSTRYATLMLESENSQSSEMWNYATYALGYKGATHDIAHRRPEDFSGKWDRWRAEQHAYFLQRLRGTREGDGNMLDRTVVLWGSAHPHASHSTQNYPIHLAGGNALGLKHGRLHRLTGKDKVPLANLFVTMLNAVDVPVQRFADSTGDMPQLQA